MIFRLLFVFILLLPTSAMGETIDYFAKKQALYDQWEKVMVRYPVGPEREAAFRKYVTDPLGKMDTGRINDFKSTCKEAGVAYDKKLFSAGSPPWSKSFKNGGDLDTQTGSINEYYRLRKAAIKRGLKVTDNGNSFSIGSHEVTVHMPPSPYDNPTSRGGYEGALKKDVEAAERVAQTGKTSIPVLGKTVQVQRNLMCTPATAASDYYKKAQEGRDFLKGKNIRRQQVKESLNFSNKAEYKMSQEMRKAGLNPGMAIHRKSLAELDAELGNRTGRNAVDYARKVNDRTFRRMEKMTGVAAKQSAKDFAALRKRIVAAEKSGNVRKAIELRQQLNNTRQQVQRVAEMSGKREMVRRIMEGADDAADRGGRGSKFLQKASEKLKKLTPGLKRLGSKLVKGLGYAARIAQIYSLKKEYDAAEKREADWAKRIGRDPSTGGIAKEFMFGALGFHKAKERTDAAMEKMGKDKDMLSWDYLRTFVVVEAYQVLDAAQPFARHNPTTRMVDYLQKNPEFSKKLLGHKIETVPGTPILLPPPPMVAGSQKEEAKKNLKTADNPPPMIAASLKKKKEESKKKTDNDKKAKRIKPAPTPPSKKSGKVKSRPETKPDVKKKKKIVYTGFDPSKPYIIKAIALETESRICRTTGSTSETFNGIIKGSEMTVIVRQEGNDHIISGNKAQYMLVRKGYIRNQKNCGYVTTNRYEDFSPGITQGAESPPPSTGKSFSECVEQYCPGCSDKQILGVGMGHPRCDPCLDAKRSLINKCYGQ